MQCRDIERDLDSFIDGELAVPESLEVEAHLHSCTACQQQVEEQRTMKRSLRLVLRPPELPETLRDFVRESLNGELREAQRASRWQRLRRPVLLGMSGVALVVALLTATFYPSRPEVVMESMIIKHQRNLPLEITGGPEVVRSWFDGKVPFAVPPPRVEPIASLRGGRISQLGDREAAYLQYEQRGQRISVFVFDPSGLRLQAPRRAVIHNREVFIQGTRGYHIAVFQDRDLGYAIAGSVDEPEFIQFVSAIMRSP
ncbi:MAG TPA: zf-HC2 domain-containing protein [Pseudomonadota bacterium]|nr:zf-HC2 domain-containing protein [Pseudomonadota bacterium]